MDHVGSLLGALTGSTNAQIEIRLDPPQPPPAPSQQQQPSQYHPVVLDHYPSWKLHRNPFWRVKHPGGSKLLQAVTNFSPNPAYPSYTTPGSGDQQSYPSSYPPPQNQLSSSASGPPQLYGATGKEPIYVYEGSQAVQGVVLIWLPPGGKGKLEHLGIRITFIGRIDMSVGIHEGKPSYDVASLSKELAPPGTLFSQSYLSNSQAGVAGTGDMKPPAVTLPFKFSMDKELESYRGRNVSVRYVLKVSVDRKFLPPITQERDVWVQLLGSEPSVHEPIKMEVGIEDCLHIEFEYERRMYHLRDTIRGKIHFLLVRIKIKHMELAVIRRETSGEGVALAMAATEGSGTNNPGAANAAASNAADGSNICTETQTLVKYEIMDGAPVKDEVIPVKLSLEGIPADLTPTYTAVNNRFSVRYYLNLVLVDEDDRRYFKQQEIILWRKELG